MKKIKEKLSTLDYQQKYSFIQFGSCYFYLFHGGMVIVILHIFLDGNVRQQRRFVVPMVANLWQWRNFNHLLKDG